MSNHYYDFIKNNFNKDILRSIGRNAVIRLFYLEQGEQLHLNNDRKERRHIYLLQGKIENNGLQLETSNTYLKPNKQGKLNIIAQNNVLLCRVNLDQLDFVISWQIMLHDANIEDEQTYKLLKKICRPIIFSAVPMDKIEFLIQSMIIAKAKAGDEIFKQGDTADTFYLINYGHMEVWQQGLYDDQQVKVADLWPGDHFGDEALIIGGTRNATIRCIDDSVMLTMNKDNFETLIKNPIVNEINVKQAQQVIMEGAHILDVRYEEEFDDGHLPNATLIPLYELRNRLDELDKNQKQLIYCLSGKRSAVGAMILREAGFDAVCLHNGTRDWPDPLVSEY